MNLNYISDENERKRIRRLKFRRGLSHLYAVGMISTMTLLLPVTGYTLEYLTGQNNLPFKRDKRICRAHVKIEFDTSKGVDISKQYEPYEKEINTLEYHSGWVEDNGQYQTTIVTYDIKDIPLEEVKDIVNGSDKSRILEKTIVRDNIPEDELSKGSYYVGEFYEVNPNDYIVTTQTKEEDQADREAAEQVMQMAQNNEQKQPSSAASQAVAYVEKDW